MSSTICCNKDWITKIHNHMIGMTDKEIHENLTLVARELIASTKGEIDTVELNWLQTAMFELMTEAIRFKHYLNDDLVKEIKSAQDAYMGAILTLNKKPDPLFEKFAFGRDVNGY